MPTYEIEMTDGRKMQVEADQAPTEQEVMDYLSTQGATEMVASGAEIAPDETDLILTGISGRNPSFVNMPGQRQVKELEAQSEADKQVLAQELKFGIEQKRNFKIAKDKLNLTLNKFNEVANKTKELTGLEPGRIAGVLNKYILGPTGLNPKIKGFRGSFVETATAIAKLAAPSAKVGPDLIKIFGSTLPTEFDNRPEAIDQTATSITNAFINYVDANPSEFPQVPDFELFRQETFNMLAQLGDEAVKYELPPGALQVGRFQIEEVE